MSPPPPWTSIFSVFQSLVCTVFILSPTLGISEGCISLFCSSSSAPVTARSSGVCSDRIHTTRHYFPNLTPRYSFAKPLDFVVFLRCTIHFFHCSDPSDLLKHMGPFISSVTNCICVYSDILKTYTSR